MKSLCSRLVSRKKWKLDCVLHRGVDVQMLAAVNITGVIREKKIWDGKQGNRSKTGNKGSAVRPFVPVCLWS